MPTIDCGHGNGRRNRLPHLAGSIVWKSRWGRRFRLPVEADFHRYQIPKTDESLHPQADILRVWGASAIRVARLRPLLPGLILGNTLKSADRVRAAPDLL